jgi:hypothetical protein
MLGDNKVVEVWLPHNESLELIEIRSDKPLQPVTSHHNLWLHYGSSISQGSNASSPTRIWPAIAARNGGVDLYNLGLGGSAMADPFIARVIRDSPASMISLKLGINIVNLDAMRLRTFVPAIHGFLDTVREGHPDTPLILISPLLCPIQEDTPGPLQLDVESLSSGVVRFMATGQQEAPELGRLTLRRIRDALVALVERRADRNLYLLDGTRLYGHDDVTTHPLPDAVHPDTATHDLIGRRFAEYAFGPGGPFDIGNSGDSPVE